MKVLFRGGQIIDGTGSAPVVGDLLIEDNKIIKVGGVIEAYRTSF